MCGGRFLRWSSTGGGDSDRSGSASSPDAESGSSYDKARHEDLALLQKVMLYARYDEPVWGDARRVTMKEAFASERAT